MGGMLDLLHRGGSGHETPLLINAPTVHRLTQIGRYRGTAQHPN